MIAGSFRCTIRAAAHTLALVCAAWLGCAPAVVTAETSAASPTPPATLPADDQHRLEQAFALIKRDYVVPPDDEKLMTGALKGMVGDLDPHSTFYDRAEFARLQEQLAGGFAGVGLTVGEEYGQIRVYAPIEDSPAARAGIHAGDIVSRIDGIPTQGLTVADAVKRMRGEPGTQVKLTVYRGSDDATRTITITRAFIHAPSAKSRVPMPGYGYIRVSTFDDRAIADLVTSLHALVAAKPRLKGLVLDLRSNGGGILQEAVGVAGAFLPTGAAIVTVQERDDPGKRKTYRNTFDDYRRPSFASDPLAGLPDMFKTLPLVVLTNEQSVSVTEVVAAALQASHRAVVMGRPTFGKGSIQVTGGLPGGTGITLTVARYYAPDGHSIQNLGVVPDLPVDDYPDGNADDLPAIREIDLPHHLDNPQDPDEAAHEVLREHDVVEQLREHEVRATDDAHNLRKHRVPVAFGEPNDFMLRQALNWLRHRPVSLAKPG
ncbi:S41 family peptidase [Paraburkholderia sp.]|uniref:S41 family peptidase n=1 Tax=Paraburkholderia sp. TaxID=1926495 RepID=UPI003D6E009B